MGQAVNIAARIEGLCGSTGRPLLFSQDFADALSEPAVAVTEAVLKGQQTPTTVYTVAEYGAEYGAEPGAGPGAGEAASP